MWLRGAANRGRLPPHDSGTSFAIYALGFGRSGPGDAELPAEILDDGVIGWTLARVIVKVASKRVHDPVVWRL